MWKVIATILAILLIAWVLKIAWELGKRATIEKFIKLLKEKKKSEDDDLIKY